GPRQHDLGALAVERPGDRPADPARGAGDKGGFAGQIEHAFTFRRSSREERRLDHQDTKDTKEILAHASRSNPFLRALHVFVANLNFHSVFRNASMSAGPWIETAVSSRSMRLVKPASTLPAPISTRLSTPSDFIASTLSRQRTRPVTCSTRRARMASGSLTGAAVTLAMSGTAGGAMATAASASRITAAAGAISAQWKGALTGSRIERRAPRSAASATARSTAALSPLTTTWPAALSLAALHTWPCAAAAAISRAASSSRPSSAAMAPAPTGTA